MFTCSQQCQCVFRNMQAICADILQCRFASERIFFIVGRTISVIAETPALAFPKLNSSARVHDLNHNLSHNWLEY